jgi:hypothetical protein
VFLDLNVIRDAGTYLDLLNRKAGTIYDVGLSTFFLSDKYGQHIAIFAYAKIGQGPIFGSQPGY